MGVMYAVAGGGFVAVMTALELALGSAGGADHYFVLVGALWAVGGLLLLLLAARRPGTVRADVEGVQVGRGRAARSVRWEDVLRTQTWPLGSDVRDVWLETTDNALVRLPHGLPAGTVETWRAELGGPAGSAADEARNRWACARLGPNEEVFLWQALLWPFLLSGFVAGNDVVVLLVTSALAAAVSLWVLRRRRPVVAAGQDGVTVPRRVGPVLYPWSDIVDVRRRRDSWFAPFVLVLVDGSTVPLPPGLTPGLLEGWRARHTAPR